MSTKYEKKETKSSITVIKDLTIINKWLKSCNGVLLHHVVKLNFYIIISSRLIKLKNDV